MNEANKLNILLGGLVIFSRTLLFKKYR